MFFVTLSHEVRQVKVCGLKMSQSKFHWYPRREFPVEIQRNLFCFGINWLPPTSNEDQKKLLAHQCTSRFDTNWNGQKTRLWPLRNYTVIILMALSKKLSWKIKQIHSFYFKMKKEEGVLSDCAHPPPLRCWHPTHVKRKRSNTFFSLNSPQSPPTPHPFGPSFFLMLYLSRAFTTRV